MTSLPSIPRKVSRKSEDLKRMTLIELKEILQRENMILSKRRLIERLPDKGQSIEQFRHLVIAEINHRELLGTLEKGINQLNIGACHHHDQHVCEIEKATPVKERYKPFSTLCSSKVAKPDSKVYQIMEDCAKTQNPTKLIPLSESLEIQKQQEDRFKEEQAKVRQQALLEKLMVEADEDCSTASDASSIPTSLSSSRESLVNNI